MKLRKSKAFLAVAMWVLGASGCSLHRLGPGIHGEVGVAVAPTSIKGNTVESAGPVLAISGGTNMIGVTAPTSTAVVARLQNGLESNVTSASGNFAKALAQVNTNLPDTPDVGAAKGYDQVEILAYAACSDLTTGRTPKMQSIYGVKASGTITDNQAALIAAGVRMLDQHTAGLASQGPASAQVSSIFTSLVQKEAGDAANTTTMVFMAVCIAANTAGSAMLGL